MTMVACVYRILNVKNGRKYIGSTINFAQRKRRHFNDLKRDRHSSAFMRRDYLKCGKDAFTIEIVEYVENLDGLIQREQHWMDLEKPEYNSEKFAASSFGFRHSPETIQRNKDRNTGFGNGNAKITEDQARQIGGMLDQFTQVEIAKKFGVDRSTIQRVCGRIGVVKVRQVFNSSTRGLFAENAKKNIAGRNALPVYMVRSDDRTPRTVPSVTDAAAILGIDISAVAKRLKRNQVSLCKGFYISKEPIDAAAIAWPYRGAV